MVLTPNPDNFYIEETASASMKFEALQIQGELEWLMKKILSTGKVRLGVELGVCNGGTYYALQQIFDRLIGIDCGKKDLPFPLRSQDKYIIGDTKDSEIIDSISNIDFLLIDADHRYSGVKMDYELWNEKVVPGGMIAFHDINGAVGEDGVKRFWQEVKVGKSTEEIILSNQYFGIGIIHV